jgi:hypothetical protein
LNMRNFCLSTALAGLMLVTAHVSATQAQGDDRLQCDKLAASPLDSERPQGVLGSGLIDHNQKITVAAMAMAEKKVWAHLS